MLKNKVFIIVLLSLCVLENTLLGPSKKTELGSGKPLISHVKKDSSEALPEAYFTIQIKDYELTPSAQIPEAQLQELKVLVAQYKNNLSNSKLSSIDLSVKFLFGKAKKPIVVVICFKKKADPKTKTIKIFPAITVYGYTTESTALINTLLKVVQEEETSSFGKTAITTTLSLGGIGLILHLLNNPSNQNIPNPHRRNPNPTTASGSGDQKPTEQEPIEIELIMVGKPIAEKRLSRVYISTTDYILVRLKQGNKFLDFNDPDVSSRYKLMYCTTFACNTTEELKALPTSKKFDRKDKVTDVEAEYIHHKFENAQRNMEAIDGFNIRVKAGDFSIKIWAINSETGTATEPFYCDIVVTES